MTMDVAPSQPDQDQGAEPSEERNAVRRAALHLIWFLVLLYLLNNIDRTNVGFATLTMNKDLGLSAQTFGVAVGIFYLGYLFCEIPSNIILAKIGARRSLARMAISSGLVTMLTAFVQGPISFYIVRFLLGVAEAGYLVGIVLYLSYWFPAAYRARYNALFMLSLPLAFSLSSALAGTILGLNGTFGIAGWQWLFLLEGTPAVIVGIISLWYLADRPRDAAWLSEAQRRALETALAKDAPPQAKEAHVARMLRELPIFLRNPVVMTCGMIYLALNFGLISLTSWMPSVISTFGLPVTQVGFVTMIAPLTAAVVMVFWGRWSDQRQERVVNTSVALFIGAAGWALAALAQTPVLIVCGFVLAAIGVYATYAISFAISQTYVAPESRPVAIALIGVVGNIGGVFVPMIIGYIKTTTGSFSAGFLMVAAVMAIAGVLTYRLKGVIAREAVLAGLAA